MFKNVSRTSISLNSFKGYQRVLSNTWSYRHVKHLHINAVCEQTLQRNKTIPKKLYTVRPVTSWMDEILKEENKKPLDVPGAPPTERITIEKTMFDSYIEEYLPFKSSPSLLEEYVSTGGRVRIGKILEDLDALAGAIAYKHIDTFAPTPPTTVVTASVDRMELLMPNTVEDFKLSGHVAHVGKSSMEVFIKMETVSNYDSEKGESGDIAPDKFLSQPTPNTILFSRFTMVAIDSSSGKSIQVNTLKTRNDQERTLSAFAQDCKARKKSISQLALDKAPPTVDERLTLHDLYMKYAHAKDSDVEKNSVWMENTKLQSVFLMQPQDRNVHHKIFGGYLMRRAYELAHATGTLFVGKSVGFLALDEIAFKKPVPVGSLLKLSSEIIYAEGAPHRSMQVRVIAEVINPEIRSTDITNTFHFTLVAPLEKPVPRVLPKTYSESMLYLEGKRRRDQGVHARKQLLNLMLEHRE